MKKKCCRCFWKEIEKIYEVMHVKHNVEMEYLFVDDGSTDRTLMFLREQEAENPRVNHLSFPVTSEKRQRCLPVWKRLPVTM